MSMKEWAKKEVKLACKREKEAAGNTNDWEYGCSCYKSALRAFNSLLKDGHSGFSISMTKHILNRLIDGQALTPIEDTEDIWNLIGSDSSEVLYQCERASSLFKTVYPNGKIEYHDNDRFVCKDLATQNCYHNGLITRIMHEKFPIKMPYIFDGKTIVYCRDYLTDSKNGDFDTKGILYAVTPDNETIEIRRYFKEGENNWEEIEYEEYAHRRFLHHKREEKCLTTEPVENVEQI